MDLKFVNLIALIALVAGTKFLGKNLPKDADQFYSPLLILTGVLSLLFVVETARVFVKLEKKMASIFCVLSSVAS